MLEVFQFYLTTSKSITTKDALDLALYPIVFFSYRGITLDSCWCGALPPLLSAVHGGALLVHPQLHPDPQ